VSVFVPFQTRVFFLRGPYINKISLGLLKSFCETDPGKLFMASKSLILQYLNVAYVFVCMKEQWMETERERVTKK